MLKQAMEASRRRRQRRVSPWGSALEGLSSIGGHELVALAGHWAEVRERLAVARKARTVGELLRDQIDLLPETRARLTLDQRERALLIRAWVKTLGRRRAA